jgi:hypothetical protein
LAPFSEINRRAIAGDDDDFWDVLQPWMRVRSERFVHFTPYAHANGRCGRCGRCGGCGRCVLRGARRPPSPRSFSAVSVGANEPAIARRIHGPEHACASHFLFSFCFPLRGLVFLYTAQQEKKRARGRKKKLLDSEKKCVFV